MDRLVRVVGDVEECDEEVNSVKNGKAEEVHDSYFQIESLKLARVVLNLSLHFFSLKSVGRHCLAVKGPCDATNEETLFRQLYVYLVSL